jgi:transposase
LHGACCTNPLLSTLSRPALPQDPAMAQNFLSCDRDQPMLLPPDLREWLPEDHLAWFVLDAVEEMDLTPFFSGYRDDGWGRAAHDPEMMVALLLYSYAVGERSSRKIERRCAEDVAFRVIAANQAPDHTTIARFRARHADDLAGLFSEVLTLCAGPAWSRSARSPSTAPGSPPTPPIAKTAPMSSLRRRSSRKPPRSTPRKMSASEIGEATSCPATGPRGARNCATPSATSTRSTRRRSARWLPGPRPRPTTRSAPAA